MTLSSSDALRELQSNLFKSEICIDLIVSRCVSWGAVSTFALGYDPRPTSFLKDRLVFPVRNAYGEVVAFQGRALLPKMKPKYWHTSGDWKPYHLYGLYENAESIVRKGYVGLLESNFDILSAYDAGIPAVATMGVALSAHQCILLRRYTDRAVVFAQGDSAGETASTRFVEQLSAYGIRATIERMPFKDTKDFNEIVVKKGLTSLTRFGYNVENGKHGT